MDKKGSPLKGSRLPLLLLLSNLLLCQRMTSASLCPEGFGNCNVSLQDLFERAISMSSYVYSLSSDMFGEFDLLYGEGQGFIPQAYRSCHTVSITTPQSKTQTLQTEPEELLKVVLTLARSWSEPLRHLSPEMHGVEGIPESILSKSSQIEQQSNRLIQGLEKIVNLINPAINQDRVSVDWSGLSSLQTGNKQSRIYAFHNLLRCLRRDSHKIDNFLKILKCQIVYNNNC